jgi:hypothetical protein
MGRLQPTAGLLLGLFQQLIKRALKDDKKQQDLPARLKVRPFKSIAGLLQLSVLLPWFAA